MLWISNRALPTERVRKVEGRFYHVWETGSFDEGAHMRCVRCGALIRALLPSPGKKEVVVQVRSVLTAWTWKRRTGTPYNVCGMKREPWDDMIALHRLADDGGPA